MRLWVRAHGKKTHIDEPDDPATPGCPARDRVEAVPTMTPTALTRPKIILVDFPVPVQPGRTAMRIQ